MLRKRLRTGLAEAVEAEQKAWIEMHSSKEKPSVIILDHWLEAVDRLTESREAAHLAGWGKSILRG